MQGRTNHTKSKRPSGGIMIKDPARQAIIIGACLGQRKMGRKELAEKSPIFITQLAFPARSKWKGVSGVESPLAAR
jgi:hypothetical protein